MSSKLNKDELDKVKCQICLSIMKLPVTVRQTMIFYDEIIIVFYKFSCHVIMNYVTLAMKTASTCPIWFVLSVVFV